MKIEKGSFLELVLQIIGYAVVAMILWPVLDWLFCLIFTHSEFSYSVEKHLVEPIVFGCVVGIVFWSFDKIGAKKKNKAKKN